MSVSGVYLFEHQRDELKFLRELYQKGQDDDYLGRKKAFHVPRAVTDAQIIRIAIDELYEKEQNKIKEAKQAEYDANYVTDEHGFGRRRRRFGKDSKIKEY